MTSVPDITLNNGVPIPQLGFGALLVKQDEAVDIITTALRIGYRHIDTAKAYANEKQVGQAIARSGIDPSEVFVTSKLSSKELGFDAALRAFDRTMDELGMEKIDLYLIHWPVPAVNDFVETWKALERIASEGRARSIGVSNFQIGHLQRIFDETETVPAVNQIEAHPYLTQIELRDFDARHGIATEAWSPIAQGAILGDPVIAGVAQAHGKTPAQAVLRWHIQIGNIVFPKSSSPERMRENFDIFDFELSGVEMDRISALNRNQRIGPDPDTFVHPETLAAEQHLRS